MSQGFLRVIGINLGDLTADPAGGVAGDMYFNPNTQTARIFANGVWADFGTAATTLTTPTVVSVSPSNGNISSLSQTIVVTFSEAMNTGTTGAGIGNPTNYIFSSNSGTVHISTPIDTTLTTATLHTTGAGVNTDGTGTITLTPTSNIQAATGASLASSASHTYTYIPPSSAPTILSWSPASSTISTLPATIAVTFSTTGMNQASTSGANSVTNPLNWAISSTGGTIPLARDTPITFSGAVATLPLTDPGLINGADITVTALNTIQDTLGNALAGSSTVAYHYSSGAGGGGTSSAAFVVSQEGSRKPAPNYTLNTATTLTSFSSKNETFGRLFQVTTSSNLTLGATGLPAGFSLTWYKMLPMAISQPSVKGGPTGTHYDPLIPIGNTLTVTTPGTSETDWLWCDITVASSVAAGPYSFSITAGTNSIAVTHTVWNFTMPATPTMPFYLGTRGFQAALGTYARYDGAEGALGVKYSQMLNAHRISANGQYEAFPALLNSSDPTQGLNLSTAPSSATSFNALCVPYTLGARQLLPLSNAARDGATRNGTNYSIALHASLNQVGNAAFKTNNWNYYIDEPDFTNSTLVTNLINELTVIKTNCPEAVIMMTHERDTRFEGVLVDGIPTNLVDIWCAYFGYHNQAGHKTTADYSGFSEFWLYGACGDHGNCFQNTPGLTNSTPALNPGSPDLMIDRESYHALGYVISSYVQGAKGILYYDSGQMFQNWDGVVGSSKDPWINQYLFSGNGDGTLLYPGRAGSYGLTTDQPCASIRLKNLREASYLVDMLHGASKTGADLATDAYTWRQTYADYHSYRAMLGNLLNGGSYVAPASAAPGEFYVTNIQAAAGSTNLTVYPPANKITNPTSFELWASTTAGGPYTRLCATYSGTITRGTPITISDTTGTASTLYYYRVKAKTATTQSWSEVEQSATFASVTAGGPTSVPGLSLWYAADLGVTKDGSNNVSGWADQSSTGYSLSQSTLAHKPLWVASAYNGSPTLRFAGSGTAGTSVSTYQCLDSISSALATTITDQTVYIVHKPADATTQMNLLNDQIAAIYHNSWCNHAGKAFGILSSGADGNPLDSTTASSTALQIAAYTSTPTTTGQGKIYLNGTLDKTGATGVNFPQIHWLRIGAGPSSTGNSGVFGAAPVQHWYSGDISEVIIYNIVHNSTQMATITAYLKTKYGLA